MLQKGMSIIMKKQQFKPCTSPVTNRASGKNVMKHVFTKSILEKFLQRDFFLHPSKVPLGRGIQIDNGAMDCCSCEALWRIGSETATVLPCVLVETLCLAEQEEDIVLHKKIVEHYFRRSDLVFVPIRAHAPNHWTVFLMS